jgi:hypothetical protein
MNIDEKSQEISISQYHQIKTKKEYKIQKQNLKKLIKLTFFFLSLIIFLIQLIRISTLASNSEILKSKSKILQNYISKKNQLSKIFSPKIIPYKSKNHLDSIIDNILFPYKSSIIESMEDIEFIRETLGQVGIRTLYKATMHGDNVIKFQERTKIHNHILILIKTKKGNRFGGYTSLNFEPVQMAGFTADIDKMDESSFLFNLDENKVYNVKKNLSALYCDYFFVLHIGEGDLIIWNNFLTNGGMSDFPENFGKGANKGDLTKEGRKFQIVELEAYHISFFESHFSKEFDVKHRYGKYKV